MFIPFSIILDELKFNHTVHLKENESPTFKWVSMLPQDITTPSKMNLQVCTLTEALAFNNQKKEFYFLCLRDRIADNLETEETLQNMIIVNENINIRKLFNSVQEVFIKVKSWIIEMQQAVIKGKGLQHLLDVSEPIMNNYIQILDPTFKILAYTKNNIYTEDDFHEVVTSGYLPEEGIKKIQEAGIIGLYRKTDNIIINKKKNVCDYVTVERCFWQNENYIISVVMIFCYREFSQGQVALFKILTDNIKSLLEIQYQEGSNFCPEESLITDLLNDRVEDVQTIKRRASYLNIPFETTFRLLLITFTDYTNIPERQVASKVSEILYPAKGIPYEHQILILNYSNGVVTSAFNDNNMLQIQNLAQKYDAFCGMSNSFSYLYELPIAYRQAEMVIPLGKWTDGSEELCNSGNTNRIFKFEDYYIPFILDTCLKENSDLLSKSLSMNTLKTLQDHDFIHNTEYLKILYHFLLNERRASDASKFLNMHRNTVVYHIEKITELIHLDLEDPEVRLKLLLGYKILELTKKVHCTPPFINNTEKQTDTFP